MGAVYDFSDEAAQRFTAVSAENIPNQLEERTPEWYFRNVQYILSFYNTPDANTSNPYGANLTGSNSNNSSSRGNSFYDYPVNKMKKYWLYYLGEQENLNYNFLTPGESTVFWTKGKDIRVGIDNMRGTAQDALTGLKFGADPLSPEVVSRREKLYHQEMFKFLMKPFMEEILKNAIKGPQAMADFKTPESVKDWIEYKFKEHLSDTYIKIAKNNWTSQYWIEDGVNIFTSASVCGLSGVEHYMDNGYYKKMVHAPQNLIYDNRVDSDFNRYGRFVGAIQEMTLMQVFSRYTDLSNEQRKELSEIASSQQRMNALNTGPVNFPWWNTTYGNTNVNKDIAFNVVRVYFIAPEIIDGEVVEELYSAEVIGNKYMVNFGKVNNVITDPNAPYVPMLPILLWMPNMIMGRINSFVSRVSDLQDEYDLYRFKLREIIANSKGRKYVVFGDKLGGKNVKQMIVDDWDVGPITVVSSTGTYNNIADRGSIVQQVDLTMDPNVIQLMNIKDKVNAELLSYMSQSSATLGRQTKYMGQKSYQGNVEQASKGTAVFFDDFMNFIQRNIRYGMNLKKNLYADGQLEEEAQTVIGERGIKMLKDTKELFAEDFLIYLQLDDAMDDALKNKIFEIVKAFAQNTQDGYTASDLIELLTSPSSSAMKEKIKARDKEISDQRQQNMVQQLQAKQQMEQAKMQQEEKLASMEAQVKSQGQHLNFIAKKLKLGMQSEQDNAEQLPVADTSKQNIQENNQQQPQEQQE